MPGSEICSSAIEDVERRIVVETKAHRTKKRPHLKAGRLTPHCGVLPATYVATMLCSGQAKDGLRETGHASEGYPKAGLQPCPICRTTSARFVRSRSKNISCRTCMAAAG